MLTSSLKSTCKVNIDWHFSETPEHLITSYAKGKEHWFYLLTFNSIECYEMDKIIPCMSMWVVKSVESVEIVDYFFELRWGSEGLSFILESERGLASDFPLEIVSYHFQIKEKSSVICVTHHKEMKTSKWRSPFRIFFNNWLSHGMFVRMFLVNHRSNRRCYMNCALALAPWKATNFYVVSFRKVVFRCVQNNWKHQVVARLR